MRAQNIKTSNLILIILILFGMSFHSFSQSQNVRERVFIDINAHDLLVGETLLYSTTVLSHTTNKLSPLSKYLYVELIGENGVVFQRKHELSDGKASGEFFLPSSIETGQYYLLAYTRWMRNFEDVAQVPILFINPYKEHLNLENDGSSLSVEFSTVSGELVSGESNTVNFKVLLGNQPFVTSGRIVGDNGKIADISSNRNGIGSFDIKPESGKGYQLLIENENGEMEFFDLPQSSENSAGLNISHNQNTFRLAPIGRLESGKLVIEHQGNVIYEKSIENSLSTTLTRNDLPRDVLELSVLNSRGDVLFTTPFFNQLLDQNTAERNFSTRTTVSIEQELPKGNYSISIRKSFRNSIEQNHSSYSKLGLNLPASSNHSDLQQMASFMEVESVPNLETVSLLPEYRYELLEGHIKALDQNTALDYRDVVLSLTGEDDLNMAFARTNEAGKFVIEYQSVHRGEVTPAHVTVPEFENEFVIELEDNFIKNHDLTFEPVFIDTTQLKDIKERSIISQLENAYYTPSLDTISIENTIPPTIPYFNAHYNFDDYTRFRTLKEHFVEYIQPAGVRERRGEKRFVLYSLDIGFDFESEPLVLLDGVPVMANEILEFSPYRIKAVEVFSRRFFMGSLVADGVISFETIEGNLGGFSSDRNHVAFELLTPQPKTEQQTFIQKDQHIPDSRIQLLWLPDFRAETDGIYPIEFNTSDIEGSFEMVIEGFSEDGIPVSIVKNFKVKELNNEEE